MVINEQVLVHLDDDSEIDITVTMGGVSIENKTCDHLPINHPVRAKGIIQLKCYSATADVKIERV